MKKKNFLISDFKMDPVQELVLGLFDNLRNNQIKNIKSPIGVIELVCDLVEEACHRVKKADINLNSLYKNILVISALKDIAEKLIIKNIITEDVYNKTLNFLNEDRIEELKDTISDIITIWNDAKMFIEKKCSCWKVKKHISRKFETLSAVSRSTQV